MRIPEWIEPVWHWLTTSRYTRELENSVHLLREDILRLRQENRGLLNSVLVRGGFQPVEEAAERTPVSYPRTRSPQQLARHLEMQSRPRAKADGEG